jgi:hypothetical protein
MLAAQARYVGLVAGLAEPEDHPSLLAHQAQQELRQAHVATRPAGVAQGALICGTVSSSPAISTSRPQIRVGRRRPCGRKPAEIVLRTPGPILDSE